MGLIWLRIGTGGCRANSNEFADYIECIEFLD